MGVGAERLFRFDTYTSATGVSPNPQSLVLSDLYTLLEHEETDCKLADGSLGCRGKKCPQKDGLAWSAGFIDDPCRCGTASRPSKHTKRCARCGSKTRFAGNVAGLDVAMFDIDHVSQAQLETMCLALEGTEVFLHTTHNHVPPGDQSFRLVLPFTRTITPDEWKQIWFSIVRKFDLPVEKNHGVDKATRDPARLAFFPRAMRGRPFLNIHEPGALLDPHELLRENVQHSRQVLSTRTPAAPPQAHPGGINLKDLMGFLRRYNPAEDAQYDDTPERQKSAIVQRIVNEEPLAEKGCRGLTMLRAGAIVGWCLPINTPIEAASELVRPALSKTPTFDDDDESKDSIDAWLGSFQRGYESAQAEKLTKVEEDEGAVGKLHRAIAEKKARTAEAPTWSPLPPPLIDATRPHVAAAAAAAANAPPEAKAKGKDDWRIEKLITTVDKQGIAHSKNTSANITIVLQNHDDWKGVLRYNDLTNEPEAHGGPIPLPEREPDRLITAICDWMVCNEELDIQRGEVINRIVFVAKGKRHDPIKSYLTEKISWDGKPRLKTWLVDYCGARTMTDDGKDVTKYVQMVGEKWLMAGAARGLYPGCKADNVLVFEGLQYAGKSKALDILGGEWFVDTQLNLGDKSTLEMTSRSWIIELSELSSMKKTETEAQKSFFSKRADSFRLAYAERVGKYARRCIFAGTTNETRYLLDLTGNRRFWCIWCELFDMVALRRDRDQLWAEAVAKVRAGETCSNCNGVADRCPEHRWWLSVEETAEAELVATSRLKNDFAEEIQEWWFSRHPAASAAEGLKRPIHLTTKDILVQILEFPLDRKEQHQTAIGRAMKSLGFIKTHLRKSNGREWVYEPSEELKSAPKEGGVVDMRLRLLSNIANAKVSK